MEKHDHYGHRSRLRQRVKAEGLDNFQDYQVLEYALSFVIPYKDTNPLAHKLIKKFGSFAGVLEADEQELVQIKGMGEASAHFLTSILKMYNFYEREKLSNNVLLTNSQIAYGYFKSLLSGKLTEEIYVACLTPKRKIVKLQKVAEGNATEVGITIRQITDIVSATKVNNVIIAHNHPSGSSKPSREDDFFTQTLATALALTDTMLLDHIIIGDDGDWYSYWLEDKISKYINPYLKKFRDFERMGKIVFLEKEEGCDDKE